MGLASVIHEHCGESGRDLVVEAKREVDSAIELGVVDAEVWTHFEFGNTFGERDVIGVGAGWGSDSVAAGAKADHREFFGFGIGDPVSDEANFFGVGVPFESCLEPRSEPIGRGVSVPRSRQIHIDKTSAERPLII